MCEACGPIALLTHNRSAGDGQRRRPPGTFGSPSRHGRSSIAAAPTGATADLVIVGGPILTMDEAGSRAESVAIREGRIVAVGSTEELASQVGPDTEVLDLDGRALLPGLVDPHMHASMVLMADWVDVSPMTTPTADDVLSILRGAAPMSTGWVVANQFDPSITEGHPRLDRDVLDRLAPDRPMLVLESNGHVGYVNSAAMRAAGVDRDTADPSTGRYGRAADGELNGRLEEAAAMAPFMVGIPALTAEELLARHRDLLWHAAGKGVTMLHDCGIGVVGGASDLDVLAAAVDADSPVRYRGMLVSTAYDTWVEMGLKPGFGDDRLRIDGIKAWSDGSNQAGTGFQRDPYLGSTDRGSLNYSPEALGEVVQRAHRDGWQIGVHANGDAAIDVTIDAFEQALADAPRPDHRHRIEHCSVLHADQIERMVTLGLSPSFLIGHVRWWGRAFRDRLFGPERADRYDPCASALAAGMRISLHSDWNVTPIEPLRYVEDAVTRIMAEGGEVLNGDERIPVEAALRAVTADAAWQCRADDITGSIEVGKYADLVLLEEDPTAVDSTSIAAITVSETRLAGAVRHTG